jgi:glycosyltransferase involved in cell wall biosynthesis
MALLEQALAESPEDAARRGPVGLGKVPAYDGQVHPRRPPPPLAASARVTSASAPAPAPTPVAVVICSRDRPRMLSEALAALRSTLRPIDEAVVVDSASRSGETATVAAQYGIRVVRCERPGASRARNVGMRATSAPLVAFTDDDCRVKPDWTQAIDQAFADPTVGFLSGRALADRSEGPVVSAENSQTRQRFENVQDPHAMGHGASMAFRREALTAAGGFDERLGAGVRLRGAEEKDLFWRLLRQGWAGLYEPSVCVVHVQWRGRVQVARTNFGYGLGAGAFSAKAIRLSRTKAWRLIVDRVWNEGFLAVLRAARQGHVQGVIDRTCWVLGVLIGGVVGTFLPLDGERFRAS